MYINIYRCISNYIVKKYINVYINKNEYKNFRPPGIGVSNSISIYSLVYTCFWSMILFIILGVLPPLTPPLGAPGNPDIRVRTTWAVPRHQKKQRFNTITPNLKNMNKSTKVAPCTENEPKMTTFEIPFGIVFRLFQELAKAQISM